MKVIRNFKLVTPELCEAGGAGRVGGGAGCTDGQTMYVAVSK